MRKPRLTRLHQLNQELQAEPSVLYRKVLLAVVPQWTRLSGDASLEQAVRSWDVPRMIALSDSLSSVVHDGAALHHAANQVSSLIRKYPWTRAESGFDPEGAAIKTFLASEHRCRRMNQWFSLYRTGKYRRAGLFGAFDRMRNWIGYVLGTLNLQEVYGLCDYTAGASLGVHGDETHLGRKLMVEEITITPTARPYYVSALNVNWHYSERFAFQGPGGIRSTAVDCGDGVRLSTRLVDYNKLAFVPKTAKTYRSIAVEPLGNSFLQKGTDLVIRKRLKRVGLDLTDQSLNRQFARKGSLPDDDPFVTIDLSSASDSISIGLCREVLPADWYDFLCQIRSPCYRIEKSSSKRYEKFVTMGNGFCFPLQTLLFSAMIVAVRPQSLPSGDFRVYGDDIVVRQSIAKDVLALLKRCGFVPNRRKTFVDGPFRESCGSNWYRGEDVNVMTLDYALDSLSALFKFLNLSRRNMLTSVFLSDARRIILSAIPDEFLLWRPYRGRPDTGIDLEPDLVTAPIRWKWNSELQCHSWWELWTKPCVSLHGRDAPAWVHMASVIRFSGERFTYRRKVKVRVVRCSSASDEVFDYDDRGCSY